MKKTLLPPLIPLVVVTLVAEFLVRQGFVRAYLVPAPSAVFRAMLSSHAELLQALASTSAGSLAGFALSAVTGIAIAILLSSSRGVQRAFYPYAIFFQTVPLIAVAPLLVIWFGFGIETVIASAFVASVFPVIANTLSWNSFYRPAVAGFVQALRGIACDHSVQAAPPRRTAAGVYGTASIRRTRGGGRHRGRIYRRRRTGFRRGRRSDAAAHR